MAPKKKTSRARAARKPEKIVHIDLVPSRADLVRQLIATQHAWELAATTDPDAQWRDAADRVAVIISSITYGLHATRRATTLRLLATAARTLTRAERAELTRPLNGRDPIELSWVRHARLTYDLDERGERGALAALIRGAVARQLDRSADYSAAARYGVSLFLEYSGARRDVDEAIVLRRAAALGKAGAKKAATTIDAATTLVRAIFVAAGFAANVDPFGAEKTQRARSRKKIVTSRRV